MSSTKAQTVQDYRTVLNEVAVCSIDVVRQLQSTGLQSCCMCDVQQTSLCRQNGVAEHQVNTTTWHLTLALQIIDNSPKPSIISDTDGISKHKLTPITPTLKHDNTQKYRIRPHLEYCISMWPRITTITMRWLKEFGEYLPKWSLTFKSTIWRVVINCRFMALCLWRTDE